jgi:aryl-alcohol dehydrogenase-like predicted oxidoreductase
MADLTKWDRLRLFGGVIFATLSMITLGVWNWYQFKTREAEKAHKKITLDANTDSNVNIE